MSAPVPPKSTKPTNGLRRSIIFKNIFMGIGGLALVVLAFAVLIQSSTIDDLRRDGQNNRLASECRFDVNAEVSEISGNIDITVAQIVLNAISDNDDEVRHLGQLLATEINDLESANVRRSNAVEECNGIDTQGSEEGTSRRGQGIQGGTLQGPRQDPDLAHG